MHASYILVPSRECCMFLLKHPRTHPIATQYAILCHVYCELIVQNAHASSPRIARFASLGKRSLNCHGQNASTAPSHPCCPHIPSIIFIHFRSNAMPCSYMTSVLCEAEFPRPQHSASFARHDCSRLDRVHPGCIRTMLCSQFNCLSKSSRVI